MEYVSLRDKYKLGFIGDYIGNFVGKGLGPSVQPSLFYGRSKPLPYSININSSRPIKYNLNVKNTPIFIYVNP